MTQPSGRSRKEKATFAIRAVLHPTEFCGTAANVADDVAQMAECPVVTVRAQVSEFSQTHAETAHAEVAV